MGHWAAWVALGLSVLSLAVCVRAAVMGRRTRRELRDLAGRYRDHILEWHVPPETSGEWERQGWEELGFTQEDAGGSIPAGHPWAQPDHDELGDVQAAMTWCVPGIDTTGIAGCAGGGAFIVATGTLAAADVPGYPHDQDGEPLRLCCGTRYASPHRRGCNALHAHLPQGPEVGPDSPPPF